ncbi:MAG: hypothetical protein SCK29_12975 [Bacillota bacterium]|nr:hypothetical protein [Bacillota bacterium]MDW7685013.1 hypothetical protein [Bacillota bacterium]
MFIPQWKSKMCNDKKSKENLDGEELKDLLLKANDVLDEMKKKDNEIQKQIDESKGKAKNLMDKINNNFSELDKLLGKKGHNK